LNGKTGLKMIKVSFPLDSSLKIFLHYEEGRSDFDLAVIRWLNENIGKECHHFHLLYESDERWYLDCGGGFHFYFKNKEDAILFKLTWGGR